MYLSDFLAEIHFLKVKYHKHSERMQSCISLKFSQNCFSFSCQSKVMHKVKIKKGGSLVELNFGYLFRSKD